MKKGSVYEGTVEEVRFPNRGIVRESLPADGTGEDAEFCPVTVKNVFPGQRVKFAVSKKRGGTAEGRLLEVLKKSPEESDEPACPHFGSCGGCRYQTLPYGAQLRLKEGQVKELLRDVPSLDLIFEGILPAPRESGYRNKMEFTFGDEFKGGPLTLGLHRIGGMYDIVSVEHCRIADGDFRKILIATQEYFRESGTPFYHRVSHEGYLRHLLVRKAARTGEILLDLVTTTQLSLPGLLEEWRDLMLALPLEGEIAGILHTVNDSPADAVIDGGTEILFGKDYFYEEILGLKFKITPFSFFQTNSLGAELLYETARGMIRDAYEAGGKVIYDLYSGTGTIAQLLSPAVERVIGVEIVEEAVEAARENARENGIGNCEFIAGDVLKVIDELPWKPDFIVLDPPREGVHPKALKKIMNFGAEQLLYISCKPTSLAGDLALLREGGYRAERICCVDMFPGTVHVETVVLLGRRCLP